MRIDADACPAAGIFIMLVLFLCLTVTACGKGTDAAGELETAVTAAGENAETEELPQTIEGAADIRLSEEMTEADADKAEQESEKVITVYTTEDIRYSDEEIPVQYTDDLSMLDHMGQTDGSYAYRDGKVYYRQYHKDSFEESALWAYYQPTAGTDKEIVCIDADGEKTVLFSDKGYGSIYLVGERFYMTEKAAREPENSGYMFLVYSVDMRGQNRVDHGYGEICAVDMDRELLILALQAEDTWEKTYNVLDCGTGQMIPLDMDDCESVYFWTYHDGWCYFDVHQNRDDKICRVAAVSAEGEQREIIALTSENADNAYYCEEICEMGVFGDRIYMVFGGYDGSASAFQGGRIISIKLDGSDYRAVEMRLWDGSNDVSFYICHDAGRPFVYFPRHYRKGEKDYFTGVWDVEADTVFPSEFPVELVFGQRARNVLPYQEHLDARSMCVLKDEETNVYALLDDSARIVRVAALADSDMGIRDREDADYIKYQHLYYADGFLYFEEEFNIYDKESSVGWRDGYRRLRTDVYRMELEGNRTELLYSY